MYWCTYIIYNYSNLNLFLEVFKPKVSLLYLSHKLLIDNSFSFVYLFFIVVVLLSSVNYEYILLEQ